VCSGGTCQVSCGAGLTNCSGVCRDLTGDRLNCGVCGNTCLGGEVCTGSTCQVSCGGGLSNCGGVCRDLGNDRLNCGSCGNSCAAGQVCSGGACQFSCPSGQVSCGGVCRDSVSLSCSASVDLGTLGAGSLIRTDLRSLPAGGQQHWFLIRFPENPDFARHGTGTPRIVFARNDGNAFRFDLYRNCSGAGQSCGSGSYNDRVSYSFNDGCGGSGCRSRNIDWPTTLWLRVRRVGGNACSAYRLQVTR
jgi:hypothetical protein